MKLLSCPLILTIVICISFAQSNSTGNQTLKSGRELQRCVIINGKVISGCGRRLEESSNNITTNETESRMLPKKCYKEPCPSRVLEDGANSADESRMLPKKCYKEPCPSRLLQDEDDLVGLHDKHDLGEPADESDDGVLHDDLRMRILDSEKVNETESRVLYKRVCGAVDNPCPGSRFGLNSAN